MGSEVRITEKVCRKGSMSSSSFFSPKHVAAVDEASCPLTVVGTTLETIGGHGPLVPSEGAKAQSKAYALANVPRLPRSSALSSMFRVRLGTMAGKSVRWTCAAVRVAKARPRRPVPEPSSRMVVFCCWWSRNLVAEELLELLDPGCVETKRRRCRIEGRCVARR